MRPHDLTPVAELAERPHGTRTRYVSGRCRCEACAEANRAYARLRGKLRRDGDVRDLVPATRARRHLISLSQRGIGRRTVADISGIGTSSLSDIRRGAKLQIRASTERAILAVTKAATHDAMLVKAGPTWVLLRSLLEEGFSKAEFARRLGLKSPALQLKRDFITARNAARVERLFRSLNAGGDS